MSAGSDLKLSWLLHALTKQLGIKAVLTADFDWRFDGVGSAVDKLKACGICQNMVVDAEARELQLTNAVKAAGGKVELKDGVYSVNLPTIYSHIREWPTIGFNPKMVAKSFSREVYFQHNDGTVTKSRCPDSEVPDWVKTHTGEPQRDEVPKGYVFNDAYKDMYTNDDVGLWFAAGRTIDSMIEFGVLVKPDLPDKARLLMLMVDAILGPSPAKAD